MGKEVWLTQLAAEYHESMCEFMANQFCGVYKEEFQPLPAVQLQTDQNINDPAAGETKKAKWEK